MGYVSALTIDFLWRSIPLRHTTNPPMAENNEPRSIPWNIEERAEREGRLIVARIVSPLFRYDKYGRASYFLKRRWREMEGE